MLALGVLASPLASFVVAAVLVEGRRGSIPYFEAVAQIIPLLIVALVIEARYLSPRPQLVRMLPIFSRYQWVMRGYVRVYTAMTFFLVVASEVIALKVLANQHPTEKGLIATAGGLAAGTVALVVSVALLPWKDVEDDKDVQDGAEPKQ